MTRFGVLICLVVALAGCQSPSRDGASAEDPTKRGDVQRPIAEWTSNDFESKGVRAGYGGNPPGILQRGTDGAPVFVPQTPDDHLAMPFVPLPGPAADRSLELKLTVDRPATNCTANLQDQRYTVLTSVPCNDVGQREAVARVSPDVTSVRVYFKSSTLEPVRLPARIQVIDLR